jgi:hypothetical protein
MPLVGEVPIFADKGVLCSQRCISPTVVISDFWTGAATFSSMLLLNCTHEVEWTPFQTHYFSENLIAPGIESGPLSVAKNSDHWTTEVVDNTVSYPNIL